MGTQPNIRKLVVFTETIGAEGGWALSEPLKKCAVAAVFKNPYAGVWQEDLTLLMEYGEFLGGYLTERSVAAMGVDIAAVHSFGKACVVGLDGEHEHAAAIMHPRLGAPLRAFLRAGKAVIPSAKKIAPAGSTLDIPLWHKDAMLVRSHYDAMTIRVPDAPRSDEILAAIALTTGGRPHARIGGLAAGDIKGVNGLD